MMIDSNIHSTPINASCIPTTVASPNGFNNLNIQQHQFPEGEEVLLWSLFHNKQVDIIIAECAPDTFFNPFRKSVYIEICKYFENLSNGEIHFTTIKKIMEKLDADSQKQSYLTSLYNLNPDDTLKIEYVIPEVQDKMVRRKLITTLTNKLDEAQNIDLNVNKTITEIEDKLSDITIGGKEAVQVIMKEEIPSLRCKGLTERYYSKGVYTQWENFDAIFDEGFEPGKLSVIAGRTGMGKSYWKTNLIINMCNKGIGVMSVCPEQGLQSEHDRIDSIMTSIPLKTIKQLRKLEITDPKINMLKKNSEYIAKNWNYSCVPNRSLSVNGIRTAIKKMKRKGIPLDIVFIDLFDTLSDVNVAKDKANIIGIKLALLNKIGEEEKVHMCVLVQIGRASESLKDKRPRKDHLKGSGNYEEAADNIFLLYREGYYNHDLNDNILEVEIAKQRNGSKGNVTFQFLVVDPQTFGVLPMGIKAFATEESQQ